MRNKLRVWDKKHKCWDDSNYIYIDQDGDIYLIEERNWAMSSFMHREEVSEQYEVVWFTGLKDKNGKEIYEGDIVKVLIQSGYSQHFTDIEHMKEVEYSENRACWTPFDRCHLWKDEHGTFKAIEVIGNIYENPELLGEAK